MTTKPMFSLVIPCYNEEGNIEELIQRCKSIFTEKDFEIIFVENGSTDNSLDLFEKKLKKIPNFKLLKIKKNLGIGNGIHEGLKASSGSIIGWTHGDLQADPLDARKAFNLSKSLKGNFLIKGKRLSKNRSIVELFFTYGLALFESILFCKKFWEVNAQPNIFNKEFFNLWNNPPNDYNIDIFCFATALMNEVKIKRFNVIFRERFSGQSKWNKNIFVRLIFISKTIIYSIKLRFKKNDNNKT